MKSSSLRHVACLLFAGCFAQHVASAQTVPSPASLLGGGLAEPAPPRPGDALMTCKQIAREMGEIMRARNVRLDANGMPSDQCNPARPAARMGAANGAMLAQLGGAMRAMNDPRLMRLSQLAQEKSCANQEPDPTPTDDCGSGSGPGNAAPRPIHLRAPSHPRRRPRRLRRARQSPRPRHRMLHRHHPTPIPFGRAERADHAR